jgi:hypothetical protein
MLRWHLFAFNPVRIILGSIQIHLPRSKKVNFQVHALRCMMVHDIFSVLRHDHEAAVLIEGPQKARRAIPACKASENGTSTKACRGQTGGGRLPVRAIEYGRSIRHLLTVIAADGG